MPMSTPMKALLIGGTGTISSAVTQLLLANGWEVFLLNRGSKPVPAGTRSLIADANNPDAVANVLGDMTFDVVAQFVGYTERDALRDILLFAGKTKQYVFISSTAAYQKPVRDFVQTESTPLCNPYWEYARNKAAAEAALLAAYREQGFPVTIVRPSHTYCDAKVPVGLHGANGSWQVLRRMLDGKPVIIHGDGSSLWTMTHADDFARGFVGLLANPHAIGTAVHITSDESMTWDQIYGVLADALGVSLCSAHIASTFLAQCGKQYDFQGSLLGDKACSVVFDNAKIKRLVPGFSCAVSMAEGLRRAVRHTLNTPSLQTPDPAFDAWCDKVLTAQSEAHMAFFEPCAQE